MTPLVSGVQLRPSFARDVSAELLSKMYKRMALLKYQFHFMLQEFRGKKETNVKSHFCCYPSSFRVRINREFARIRIVRSERRVVGFMTNIEGVILGWMLSQRRGERWTSMQKRYAL